MLSLWRNALLVAILFSNEVSASPGCGAPEHHPNTKLQDQYVNKNVYGDDEIARYICVSGYYRASGSPAVRCLKGKWTKLKLKCERKNCGSAGDIFNGHFEYEGDALFGDRVTAVCKEGYYLKGNRYRQCQDFGWDGRVPSCEEGAETTCPSPSVANGVKIRGDASVYLRGQNVTFACNDGFALRGPSEITCGPYGRWQPDTPRCLSSRAVTCDAPPEVADAVRSGPLEGPFESGTVIGYQCQRGQLIGEREIHCMEDGTWSSLPPECQRDVPSQITCPNPYVLNGVMIRGDAAVYNTGDSVTFDCTGGFLLRGSPEITCGEDGQWHPNTPSCVSSPGNCGAPPDYPHMHLTDEYLSQTDFPPGAEVRYTCALGYRALQRSRVISRCLKGKWTRITLKCERKSCGSAGEILNGRYEYKGVLFGDTAVAVCNDGYELTGRKHRHCMDKGWDGIAPVCDAVKCPPPPEVADAVMIGQSEEPFVYGTVIAYRCPRGELRGQREIHCTRDGTWSSPPPQCTREVPAEVTCPRPYVANGVRSKGDAHVYNKGHSVTFTCNDGFFLKGSQEITCGPDGRWRPDIPECLPVSAVTCDTPPEVADAVRTGPLHGPFVYGTVIGYQCRQGRLIGERQIHCTRDGAWSSPPPECQRDVPSQITCPNPYVPNGVKSRGDAAVYNTGDSVTFDCTGGFLLRGSPEITCGEDGQWHPNTPSCVSSPGNCGAPPNYTNIHPTDEYLSQTDFPPGAEVRYTCALGYKALPRRRVISRCLKGKWTPISLKCEPKSCGSAGEILNGHYEYTGIMFGDTATAVCREGYELIGRKYRHCMDKGWDGRVPVCEAVKCTAPPEVDNGVMSGQLDEPFLYGTVITYRCRQGQLIGERELHCTQNGTWSSPPPQCTVVTCASPYVENGMKTGGFGTSYKYKDYVSFTCNVGYNLSGPSKITCGPDGEWIPSIPQCEAVTCADPEVDFAKRIIGYGRTYGDSVSIICKQGYYLSGPEQITCGVAGQWLPSLPRCLAIPTRHHWIPWNGPYYRPVQYPYQNHYYQYPAYHK
ncbi:complement receptor type 2-like isoform X2 [Megalops cyprinoides]|uniref:complement receptor type 2-like isoform X2 n=1 Tax=Megalops cyprinoides TaxID=118141 RepID=UPI0018651EEB|nr:complement receptor type 2-like isoform X2 [Megalops cyprinoides]